MEISKSWVPSLKVSGRIAVKAVLREAQKVGKDSFVISMSVQKGLDTDITPGRAVNEAVGDHLNLGMPDPCGGCDAAFESEDRSFPEL